jgi:hypothetical protein
LLYDLGTLSWRFLPGSKHKILLPIIGWGTAAEPGFGHLRVVYVIDDKNGVIESAWEKGWNDGTVIVKGTAIDSALAAIQWDNGNSIRVYFQRAQDVVESAFDSCRWNGFVSNPIPIYH